MNLFDPKELYCQTATRSHVRRCEVSFLHSNFFKDLGKTNIYKVQEKEKYIRCFKIRNV